MTLATVCRVLCVMLLVVGRVAVCVNTESVVRWWGRFRNSTESILIATDVAARGLDIPLVDHVIHYQLPRTAEVCLRSFGLLLLLLLLFFFFHRG